MDSRLPVLIVGAGPTGLMMACELARHGIAFRIIEKKSERTKTSNATWIQTRTIELLDHIGLVDRFLTIGHRCHGIHLYANGKLIASLPLNNIGSLYPFILMLPQSETERLLEERLHELGFHVERSCELMELKQSTNEVTSTIRYADGRTETVTNDWLVACDGANSTVRQQAKIFFSGSDMQEQFMVADAKIDSYMSKDDVHVFFDKETIFAAFPMGANHYRIAANLHLTHTRQTFTEREAIEIVQERAHGEYYVNQVSWVTPFWIHSKIVKQMRHGSIFLAGDAAHIHSPLGGQGMNTGLQDAYNLAWKLALTIKRQANAVLLDSYQAERFTVVNQVVKQTERYTNMAVTDKQFITKLRKFGQEIKKNKERLAQKIAKDLTQLNIKYRRSAVIDYTEKVNRYAPAQGERAPDVMINQKEKLYDYLRNTSHNVLLFAGLETDKNKLAKLIELQQWLNQTYPDFIHAQIVTKTKLHHADHLILDPDATIHACYHVKAPVLYLIRPDNYIAYYSSKFNKASLNAFMLQYLRLSG